LFIDVHPHAFSKAFLRKERDRVLGNFRGHGEHRGQKDGNGMTQPSCDVRRSVIHLFQRKPFSLKLFESSGRIDAGE
jgi:hypothetical protein